MNTSAPREEQHLSHLLSRDGALIAYDREGNGPAVILVAGAMCHRLSWSGPQLSRLLASHFTVYNYDRRGRGASGDTLPYAVQREIEDLEALIDAAGGVAHAWGHSAGAALAIEAAATLGRKVSKLAFYDVPYALTDDDTPAWRQYTTGLRALLAAGQPAEAAALFLRFTGMPADKLDGLRQSPKWARIETLAPTLAYDQLGLLRNDRAVPVDLLVRLPRQTLVMAGSESPPFMRATARALAEMIPHAALRVIEGQGHIADVAVIAPALAEFFNAA